MTVFFEAAQALFTAGWTMLRQVTFPGTGMPIIVILIGAFVLVFGIKILAYVLHMHVSVGQIERGFDKTIGRRR